ncbi:MAG: SprT family zinc-dependent metalloprotease [Chloroflexota bacterium]|nr:SprT family zinc-dependent metalloprotease [Chloroflexota bacterium]
MIQTLTYNDLTFEIRPSSRRRTLEIIVDRDGSLVLATPPDVPQDALEQFIEDNLLWLYTKLAEKERQARPSVPRQYVTGEGFYYLGRSYRLKIVNAAATSRQPPLRLYRSRFEIRHDVIPHAPEHFVHWYTLHLRPILDRQLTALTDRIGAAPRQVHIQDLGYRWASANRRRHLYFHWRVAMLPYPMIEYLVAHELVHLLERYHTPSFWERLTRVIPDYAGRRQWLADEGGKYDL